MSTKDVMFIAIVAFVIGAFGGWNLGYGAGGIWARIKIYGEAPKQLRHETIKQLDRSKKAPPESREAPALLPQLRQ